MKSQEGKKAVFRKRKRERGETGSGRSPSRRVLPRKERTGMRNRKTRVNAIAAILCVLFVAGCLCIRWVNRGGNYDDAIRCLEAGDYETALEIFERLGNYRDVRQLRNYALALQSADSGSASALILARTYISRISVSYDGALCEQIRQFREANLALYRS